MPLVCYVSELEKNVSLDAERLLRLLGVSGKAVWVLLCRVYVGTGAGEAGVCPADHEKAL